MPILFQNIIDIENIEYSYNKCMLGKSKYKKDAIIFDIDKTQNINNLIEDLSINKYYPGKYNEFIIYEPKKRVIHAPTFRDKLVQRMVYNVMAPIYKNIFIKDSYACIIGKGTHAASQKTQDMIKKAKWQYGDNAYIIKIDIEKFFYSIKRDILKKIYRKKITCKKTLHLLDLIIDSAPGEIGLPLGNITSHTFANIMLNELDQYCKRYLAIKYYIRYMDDVCIVVKDKGKAQQLLHLCEEYSNNVLELNLNKNKSKIFPISQGVNFVGFKTWGTHKLLRVSSKRKIKNRARKIPNLIKCGKITIEKAEQMLNSWFGHAKHGNNYNFMKAILKKYTYIQVRENKLKLEGL